MSKKKAKKKKKKKGQRTTEPIVVKRRDVPIEDDPYWNISSEYVDGHRIGKYIAWFERFEELHPEWTYALMDGIPTYYCVLGVEHDASEAEIEAAYNRKKKLSSYPKDVIEEAFNVLSNPRLKREYDKLLVIFENVTKSMTPFEKSELIKEHSAHISTEKEFVRMGKIVDRYRDYILLYTRGMPDLYEIAGLARNATADDIRRKCDGGTELLRRIGRILGDTASREEYDFMLSFNEKYMDKEVVKERNNSKKKWKRMDRCVFEKIVLTALDEPDAIKRYVKRRIEILSNNHDWKQYLPPNNETFLSVLRLDLGSLKNSADKREVERVIRESYRRLEKTPQVNLAYSVLKNASLREDYLWLLENHEMLDSLVEVLRVEEGPGGFEIEGIEDIPNFGEMMATLIRLFAESEMRRGRIPPEMSDILASILEDAMGDRKRGKRSG